MAAPIVDSTTYPKARAYPLRHGYQARGTRPTSVVVHSTSSSKKNTAFTAEAQYLFESAAVSAHFLVGKDGRIVQFLEPAPYQAWHAGEALEAWQNSRSIGIELHHSVGDAPYPQAQMDALSWLLRDIMAEFSIPASKIETHGQIALPGPYKRKTDPSDMTHDAFLSYRATLTTPPTSRYYTVLHPCPISETPSPSGPVALGGAAELSRGEVVEVDEIKNGWAHCASGVGFVMVCCLGVS